MSGDDSSEGGSQDEGEQAETGEEEGSDEEGVSLKRQAKQHRQQASVSGRPLCGAFDSGMLHLQCCGFGL